MDQLFLYSASKMDVKYSALISTSFPTNQMPPICEQRKYRANQMHREILYHDFNDGIKKELVETYKYQNDNFSDGYTLKTSFGGSFPFSSTYMIHKKKYVSSRCLVWYD